MQELVKAARAALRVTTQDPNIIEDIKDTVAAACADLRVAGVAEQAPPKEGEKSKTWDLYKRTVVLYCKANFGNNPDADRLLARYEKDKIKMSLDADYRMVEAANE